MAKSKDYLVHVEKDGDEWTVITRMTADQAAQVSRAVDSDPEVRTYMVWPLDTMEQTSFSKLAKDLKDELEIIISCKEWLPGA